MLVLRDYQSELVDKIRTSYKNGKRAPLAVAPTGAGKTVIFSNIAQTVSARGKRVLILVHRIELLKQSSKALDLADVWHGLINPKFSPDLMAPVQVASVQTMVKRMDKYDTDFDLIIVDECHHATSKSYRSVLGYYSSARVLGVTATPVRTDGDGLGVESGGLFDDLIIGPSVSYLIERGFLVKPVIYAPIERIDLSSLKTIGGDYDSSGAAKLIDKSKITGSAVEHYSKICPDAPAVVFCINVAHAEHVADEFIMNGFRSCSIDGAMDDEQRSSILKNFENGTIKVLTSVDLIGEGFDLPKIGCAILLRPTMSTGLYIQQVGRTLRPCDGKDFAYILDHVGNVITHGLPEEEREWSLIGEKEERKRRKKEASVRIIQCVECYCMHAPAPMCPQCGHMYVKNEPRTIDQTDGELKMVTADVEKMLRKKKSQEIGRAQTLEQLLEIQAARGYKEGWAVHVFNARNKKDIGL